jgi:cytochrome b subunit of formate dehydrogenase
MFVCFTLLALTGGLLWLPDQTMAGIRGIEPTLLLEIRAWAHRIAAVLMTVVSVYHIGYTLLTRRGRELLRGLLPRPRDLRQVKDQILWMLGLRKEPVRFGFFNYGEKMEYWSFAWGTIVMSATGLILWAEHLGPKYIVDVARLVHSMEAILAVCAIVVWHFWNVHWKPGRWPMSEVWITGRIDREQMEEEHGAVLDFIETGSMPWACPVSNLVEEDAYPHNRRNDGVRKPVLRVLGWSMVLLTIASCLVMAWSFTRFLKGTENDPRVDPGAAKQWVLADTRVDSRDPSWSQASAHLDPDWRYARFHEATPALHVDPAVKRSECLLCHEGLAHRNNREVRAALNMHSRFMACEVCHSPQDQGGSRVIWADLRLDPQGDPPKPYGLERHPLEEQQNWTSLLVIEREGSIVYPDITSARAVDYLSRRDGLGEAEKDQATELFHDGVATLADRTVGCDDCHSPEGLLDFPSLGFSPDRVLQLQTSSNASSVTNYEQFYLPAAR